MNTGPIEETIAFLIGNYMTTLFVLGLIVAAVKVLRFRGTRTGAAVSGILIETMLLYGVGISLVVNFVMHSFFGDYAAKTIGWAQSPFQLELAFMSLGVGITAILLHGRWAPFQSKAAVLLGFAIFGFGAAGGHVYQMIANDDFAANNTGLLLANDFVVNIVAVALVIWHAIALRGGRGLQESTSLAPIESATSFVPR